MLGLSAPGLSTLLRIAIIAAVTVGCATLGRPPATQPGGALSWAVESPNVDSVKAGSDRIGEARVEGALELRVRWPQQAVQQLPTSVQKVDFTVKNAANQTLVALTVTRLPGATVATASAEHVPVGDLTLAASAKDATGAVVAAGATSVKVLANKRVTATLSLNPTNGPSITSFSPKAAPAGGSVTVNGANFANTSSKLIVSIGGVVVSTNQTIPGGPTQFVFFVPAGATTSAISLTVDGIKTTSADLFTTIGSLALAPADPVAATGSSTVFTATALDTAQPPVPVPGVEITFYISNQTGVNPPATPAPTPTPATPPPPPPTPTPIPVPSGGPTLPPVAATPTPIPPPFTPPPIVVIPGGAVGNLGSFGTATVTTGSTGQASSSFNAIATGSAWINVGAGSLLATTSIKVQ